MLTNFAFYFLVACAVFYIIRMTQIFYYYSNKEMIFIDVAISGIIVLLVAYAFPQASFQDEVFAGREHVLYYIYAGGLILCGLFSEALTRDVLKEARKNKRCGKAKVDNSPDFLIMSFSSMVGSVFVLFAMVITFNGTEKTYEYVGGEKIEHLFSWNKLDYSHPASEKIESIASTQNILPDTGAKTYNFVREDGSKYSLYCRKMDCAKGARLFSKVLDNGNKEFEYINDNEKVVWIEPKDNTQRTSISFYTNGTEYLQTQVSSISRVEPIFDPHGFNLWIKDKNQSILLTCRNHECNRVYISSL